MECLYFLIRISICFVLGITIGIERQCRRKIAGIRTVTLVSLGAFLFTSISYLTASDDITRISAQVVSGIGFLGAGVILRDGINVRGLNTAATLWCSAAIGTLTALGFVIEAIIGVLYILISNVLLRFISRKMMRKTNINNNDIYCLKVLCTREKEPVVRNMLVQKLKSNHFIIKHLKTNKIDKVLGVDFVLEIENNISQNIHTIINRICVEPGVLSLEYNKLGKYIDDDDDDYYVK